MARIPTCHPERAHEAHGLCRLCYQRQPTQARKSAKRALKNYYVNQLAKLAYRKEYAKRNPEKLLDYKLKRFYGITLEQYNAMLQTQGGLCAICKNPPSGADKARLAVDHNHITGKNRALLCGHCNRSLGMVKEDINILESMIRYLNEHKN